MACGGQWERGGRRKRACVGVTWANLREQNEGLENCAACHWNSHNSTREYTFQVVLPMLSKLYNLFLAHFPPHFSSCRKELIYSSIYWVSTFLAHKGIKEEMAYLVWMAPSRLQGGILQLGLTGMNRSLQERTFKGIEVWKSMTMTWRTLWSSLC